MAVVVVTDSTSDLPNEVAGALGVKVIPALIHFGQETFRDGIDLTAEEFFRRHRVSDQLPTTSQAPVSEFVEVYQELVRAGHSVVSVHISAKVSGTVNSALQAVSILGEKNVQVIDSGFWSGALGLVVSEAAEAARSGKTLEQVVTVTENAKARAGLLAVADTLEYAARGGRIGRAQYYLGSLLRIKPLLEIKSGQLHPLERPRTRAKALRRLLELVKGQKSLDRVMVTHALAAEDANWLASELQDSIRTKILVCPIGPVIGAHTGPGAIGVGFLRRSE